MVYTAGLAIWFAWPSAEWKCGTLKKWKMATAEFSTKQGIPKHQILCSFASHTLWSQNEGQEARLPRLLITSVALGKALEIFNSLSDFSANSLKVIGVTSCSLVWPGRVEWRRRSPGGRRSDHSEISLLWSWRSSLGMSKPATGCPESGPLCSVPWASVWRHHLGFPLGPSLRTPCSWHTSSEAKLCVHR